MKIAVKKTAMILIIVMVVNCFTGCLTSKLGHLGNDPISGVVGLFAIAIDIVTLPFQIIYFSVKAASRNSRGKKIDAIDTFSQAVKSLPEEDLALLIQTFDSLPEEELSALRQRFYSLPEEKLASFTETLNSISEKEIYAMAAAVNNLSETQILLSIEQLNSMSDEIFITALNNLQPVEFCYKY